ncbi:efflux transporter outer membrane subunit [Nitrospirillum pindoramense]|uniref:NodT family efflux transporter outer membrane factor (OMF) lipoprotein n=1 Tax=Nitrospirillum amazonense TaxID=28077 RepID=A0A560GZ40_9PROT|nr:efflux transporter outer membrane subunit [Nitrospirillum amazonense]TWB39121.1 NodT family efflux transporter outer membrane factor (OMF) lipoprotein [Nitrospirillum amazonense]
MRSAARRSLLIPGLCLVLAGCAVGPDFRQPDAPATTAYTPSPAPVPAKPGAAVGMAWWRGFGSPTLDAIIDKAASDNLTLVAAKARLRGVQEMANASAGRFWPQVDLEGGVARKRVNLVTFGMQGHSPIFYLYSVGATISYSLDLFGGDRRQVEADDAKAEAAAYRTAAAYVMVTGNTAVQAVTLAAASDAAQATAAAIDADREALAAARAGLAAGALPGTAVTAAEARLAQDEALLPDLRQRAAAAQNALAVLAGVAPADWRSPPLSLADLAAPANLPLSLPSQLVRQRPDIMAAEADLHAASAAVGVATANMFPRLQLTAGLEQAAASTALFWSSDSTQGGVAAGVVAPLFHGGALNAARHAAQADYEASTADYRQTVLTAFQQVGDILMALSHDGDALASAEHALAAAAEQRNRMRAAFDRGAVNRLALLAAERDWNLAGAQRATVLGRRWADVIGLYVAMGGDWRHWATQEATQAGDTAAPTPHTSLN